jgi:hypothetical protein
MCSYPCEKLASASLDCTGVASDTLQNNFRLVKGRCRRRDLNPRPPAYEADALPLSYAGWNPATDIGADLAWQAIHTQVHFAAITGTIAAGAATRRSPAGPRFQALDRDQGLNQVQDRQAHAPKG